MTRRKPVEWTKLDNAAKIFPPNSNERDTKVFRFVSELKDEIDRDILQDAVDKTLLLFPFYQAVLRRGAFWYYFESTDLRPEVVEENKLPCSMLYHRNRRNLLFEVIYYKNRINLEVFHALTDGTGALGFLKTLLYYYITIRYKDDFGETLPVLDYDASLSQKMDDSFQKHYSVNRLPKKVKITKAYRIQGRRSIDNRIKIIEGLMPVKEVLNLARSHNTTLTVYLVALFIRSISKEMPARSKKNPVVLSVPVNLRTYFPSVTARNFFATISISYNFSNSSDELEDIIREVKDSFERELTKEKLEKQMNRLLSLEHNAFMRVVPLVIKDKILRFATRLSDKGITATLSNVGKITISPELAPYIQMFNCFVSARRPQIAICSYQNNLLVSFTSPFIGTDIQKDFFRHLANENIPITIASNAKEI
ncbi:MAG: hypothetical protein EWM47_02905 [Anaerolineaceae bacterium]|nr:MAG: hypothetical protein EWM47_02905 [Anaerolineaceae bacterium]